MSNTNRGKKFMVSLPDPNRPGVFAEVGPCTYNQGIRYLQQWYSKEFATAVAAALLNELPETI